ncbi:MAG: (2Fe-2S)-binding protein [Bacteroidetes bacterium]|nr:(2Fe-2S)-binding protein [Bacteroidota bacterium]
MAEKIKFKLNGKNIDLEVEKDHTLLWVLRTQFKLTGTKFGCGFGYCGSCTVLIDGEAFRSCGIAMSEVNSKEITTIEGLSVNGDLHPVQKAFVKHDAQQCGFCTPGMILNAVGLLNANPNPTHEEIIIGMDENLCRCGSYLRIVDAIQTAALELNGGR